MATENKRKYERNLRRLRGETPPDARQADAVYGDSPCINPRDRDRIESFILAHDANDATVPTVGSGLASSSLSTYISALLTVASHIELVTATADDLNRVTKALYEDGSAASTVRLYQNALRTFYRYHTDLAADPDAINVRPQPKTTINDRDMLDRDEIAAIERALDHPRDLCIFHLLLYTGMRVNALCTLRVKDVAPEEGASGKYWFNSNADGLKGADKNGSARPLLVGKAAVRDWLKYHPTGDPEHYLITQQPKYRTPDPTVPVTHHLIGLVLKKAKEKAGIEKPLHPHMLRHNFVTIAVRDHGMDDKAVKFLLGHAPESRIMETTYAHLSGDDHVENAESAFGYGDAEADEDRVSPLVPDTCPVCGNNIRENARLCDRCGTTFGPGDETSEIDLQGLPPQFAELVLKQTIMLMGDDPETLENPRYVSEPDRVRNVLDEYGSEGWDTNENGFKRRRVPIVKDD